MKKHTALILSGALTLAIGAAVIVGNGWVASKVMAFGISEETPAKITNTGYEVQQSTTVGINFTEEVQQPATVGTSLSESGETTVVADDGVAEGKILMKTLPNGEVILESEGAAEGKVQMKLLPNGEVILVPYTATHVEGEPGESNIKEKDAISIGVKAITDKYALRQELLGRYSITAIFYTVYEDVDGAVWWVNLYPTNAEDFVEIGTYTALLNGETGEVIRLLSAADGKG